MLCRALEGDRVPAFCVVLYYMLHISIFFDRPMTPVTVSDLVLDMVSGSFWICCCHSCHVCASNCLSEESAPYRDHLLSQVSDPFTPLGFCFLGWDGQIVSLKHITSTSLPLTAHSFHELIRERSQVMKEARSKEGIQKDYCMSWQVKARYGGKRN